MIRQLNLFQFKTFKEQTFNFSNLTLLTGINGMGKSSVIQSMLVLRNSFDRTELFHKQPKLTIQDKDFVNLVSPDDMLCSEADSTKVSIGFNDDIGSAKWSVYAEGNSNTLDIFEVEKTENAGLASLFSPYFQYLSAERIGPRQSYERLSVNRPNSRLGFKGEYTASVLADTVRNLERVELKELQVEGSSNLVYDLLSVWISRIIYPGTKVTLDDSNPSSISLQYTFEHERNKTFNPLNIGFGFSFALPVILAVLTAPKGHLVIVENPEAHLHPRGQAEMGKFLALAASGGIQILIETHSDHVLNGVRLAVKQEKIAPEKTKIIFIGSYKDGAKQRPYVAEPQIDKDGRIDEWPKDFFDTWEYSLMELL
jgi:predicted ATPase